MLRARARPRARGRSRSRRRRPRGSAAGPCRRMRSFSVSPSTYSKTMYGRAVVLAGVDDADDVRVVELRHRARLAPEALELVGVLRDLAVHELDRDLPLEHGVEGAVDGRHPPGADLGVEAVAPGEQGADRRPHRPYCAACCGGGARHLPDGPGGRGLVGRRARPSRAWRWSSATRCGSPTSWPGWPASSRTRPPRPGRSWTRRRRPACPPTSGCGSAGRPAGRRARPTRPAWPSRRPPSRASTARCCGACGRASSSTAARRTRPTRSWRPSGASPGWTSTASRVDLRSNAIVEAFGADLDARPGAGAAAAVLARRRSLAGGRDGRRRPARRRAGGGRRALGRAAHRRGGGPAARPRGHRRGGRGLRPARPAGPRRAVAAGVRVARAPRAASSAASSGHAA